MTAEEIIQKYTLLPHPEGGFYKRTYKHENSTYSSILFLMLDKNFSAFHKISADEQWNWYFGDTVIIHEIDKNGTYKKTLLSNDETIFNFQYLVKAEHWFACESNGSNGFALCGCTVIPAFSFDNFVLADRSSMIEQFPQHEAIIERLTK